MKKLFNKIRIAVLSLAVCALTAVNTSCSDWLELYPEGETLLEDFWKTGDDIESVLASCYLGLMESSYLQRIVVWGEVRSDNVEAGPKVAADVSDLLDVNVLATNSYCDWAIFYQTINYCNTVIHYAPQVLDEDKNLSRTRMESLCAEAQAIRALTYFYLVRAFGDVPIVWQPTIDDSNGFDIAKSPADEVLKKCADDLEDALTKAQTTFGSYRSDYNKARFTKQSIRVLLADIYLWLGDYDNCIRHCDDFLAYNAQIQLNNPQNGYSLVDMANYYSMFTSSTFDCTEAIFSTAFYSNTTSCPFSNMYGFQNKDHQLVAASRISDAFSDADDYRGKYVSYADVAGSVNGTAITKYVASSVVISSGQTIPVLVSDKYYEYIFYRLADLYLIRAEALVEKAATLSGDAEVSSTLNDAIYMVNKTYMRACPDRARLDTLSLKTYSTVEDMRQLVRDERRREFVFEGKRWFDLIRYCRREQSAQTAVDAIEGKNFPVSSGQVALSKMSTLDALYMPISKTEVDNNKLMVQNPFYQLDETTGKNE